MTERFTRSTGERNRVRRWPALLIAGLFAVGLLAIEYREFPSTQAQTIARVGLILVCFFLLLMWLFFFSRLSRRIRGRAFGALVLFLITMSLLFRVRGVSGDFMPILEWRWHDDTASLTIDRKPNYADAAIREHLGPGDYAQFLGPGRNATLSGIALETDWVSYPPREMWRIPVGLGWSAFAVKRPFAVTQEQRGDAEMVVCYDLKTGRPLWQHSDTTAFRSAVAGDGPRATPTISGDRVYTAGTTGMLNCLDLATGRRIWSIDYLKDNGAGAKKWGNSGSPLVLDSLVIINAGGAEGRSLAAYHRDDGRKCWSAGSDVAGHSSPFLTIFGGLPQVVIYNKYSIVAHDPADKGAVLWSHPWPETVQAVAQPLPVPGERLFASTGYGVGARLLKIDRDPAGDFSSKLLWKSPRMKAKFTNVVYRNGFIYGLDDGVLACIDLESGQRRWKGGRYGHGQLILVDDVLLIQAEYGDIVLVAARPEAHRELARMPALDSKTWNNPVLAKPYLLVRNDREAVCFELTFRL